MAQVEELKQRLEESKTAQEALLEQEVLRLKEKNLATVGSLNTLNAHSHVLTKKLSDRETDLREKAENFGRCYSALKESHSVVLSQLK
jgi:translation initiation factor 6 (eIF-6)